MTKQQEEQIRNLREQGVGYKAIAKITHLSRDAVRYYCKTHNLSGYKTAVRVNIRKMMEDHTVCSYCGKPIEQNKMGRPKRFCCDDCRRKWWGQNRDQLTQKPEAVYKFVCKHCGREFNAYGNRKRIYCSHDCYIKERFWNFEQPAENTETFV